MAILKKSGDSCSFVWGADSDTLDTDAGGKDAGGGWFFAKGQPDTCTIVEVRALGEDDALECAGDHKQAWSLGVVGIDGTTPDVDAWPPLFVRAVASLVTFVQSGIVGLHPPAP
tara:strand:- start:544 stop:885 length:342 start_codon:yes stop_codon:yes gene_type:complete